MEVLLPMQGPLSCTAMRTRSTIKFFPARSVKWSMNYAAGKVTYRITASADFSRKRQRKVSAPTPRSRNLTPKGFVPKPNVPTSAQRREQKSNEEKKGSGSSSPKGFGGASSRESQLRTVSDDEKVSGINEAEVGEVSDDERNKNDVEAASTSDSLVDEENEQMGDASEEMVESNEEERVKKIYMLDPTEEKYPTLDDNNEINGLEENMTAIGDFDGLVRGNVTEDEQIFNSNNRDKWHEDFKKGELEEKINTFEVGKKAFGEIESRTGHVENVKHGEHVKNIETADRTYENLFMQPKAVGNQVNAHKQNEDLFLKLKLEREENLRNEVLLRFVKDSFQRGNKLFHYPELVIPNQHLEIFFNRNFSSLKNEPNVMIMGAFNDWRWKSFNMKLNKSDLNGDWWSCKLHVPREAYKIDFVFYNGEDVYENNDGQDFRIRVEGGMDEFDFENFLLEEKHRELEELARVKAEKERQEEERRQIEAERIADEADKVQAREEVAKRRGMLQEWMQKIPKSVDDVWYIEPSQFEGNDVVRLYYNKSSGPLSHANDIWIHGGYDSWKNGLSIVSKLIKSEKKDGDWWYAEVVVPDEVLVLDWVFADGPPKQAKIYDNNHRKDFHAIVTIPQELYWVEEEIKIYKKLKAERQLREEAIGAKVEKTARLKKETKERTLKAFLLSQKHIVYTDPLDVQAGSIVTLFYNPANTVLNGKPEIWLRCSFNRWTHRLGALPSQKMIPSENGSHLKANVRVPLDAYMMDFVFSDREDGGIFDNKNGMDYHIPVFGGVVKEPPMHIIHISVEMAPIAKVGGLGDVVTSLSRAVRDMNHNVDVILPKYDCLSYSHVKDLEFHKSYSWGGTEIKVWLGKVEGISVYFLEPQNGLFWVGCIYGRNDDGGRFGFFCHAALEFLLQSGFHPDIIHCHDWSSAPVAWLFKEQYMHYGLSKARIVFTIHNLEFGPHLIGKAMKFADKAMTVSPTYSIEVSGNPVIAPYNYKFHGILNGIDPDIWDPYNDNFIPVAYTSENVVEGKSAAKEALQQKLELDRVDRPLVGIITRLTHQKGIHLIKHAIWRTIERQGQVVLLGSAPDPRIQNDFVNLANQLHSTHHGCARLCLSYDEPLSHLIYAGADFILVPSIFEPCGLTQLTAMRYGSIPVVRKTGGLYDTVFDVDHDKERANACGLEPNGFNFDGADAAGVDYALNRALSAWYDGREWFNSLCKCVMEQDWSWNRPALDYLELYHAARK